MKRLLTFLLLLLSVQSFAGSLADYLSSTDDYIINIDQLDVPTIITEYDIRNYKLNVGTGDFYIDIPERKMETIFREYKDVNFENVDLEMLVINILTKYQSSRGLDNLPQDKQLHFKYGMLISSVSEIVTAMIDENSGSSSDVNIYTRVVLTSIIAALKEVRDMQGFGHPEWKDFAYTVAGSLVNVTFTYRF